MKVAVSGLYGAHKIRIFSPACHLVVDKHQYDLTSKNPRFVPDHTPSVLSPSSSLISRFSFESVFVLNPRFLKRNGFPNNEKNHK